MEIPIPPGASGRRRRLLCRLNASRAAFPALLLLLSAACSDKGLERDVLTAFERHSYEARSGREVLAALKAGPDALKALDPRLELLKTEKPLREMPGGGLSSGLLLGERDGGTYVLKVFRGSPAEAAGVKEGDRVLEVDGLRLPPASAAARIRGALDFRVKVGRIGPGGRLTASEAAIKKRLIVLPLIFGLHDPASRTVFIRAAFFSKGTGAAVAEGLAALARRGADRVVFDLRGNAGGAPEEAAALLAAFAPGPGPVLEVRSRHVGYRRTFRAPDRGRFSGLRAAVLVDSRTAMAAEVFAASLRELAGAVVIGETTMGDVSLTRIFRAGRRAGLQLTVARLFPPSGTELEGRGLEPDLRPDADPREAEASGSDWSASGETALIRDPGWKKALAAGE